MGYIVYDTDFEPSCIENIADKIHHWMYWKFWNIKAAKLYDRMKYRNEYKAGKLVIIDDIVYQPYQPKD